MTESWLEGNHYKQRAMRANGVEEYYITGEAADYEKFEKWAETVEKLIGNPLYYWIGSGAKIIYKKRRI